MELIDLFSFDEEMVRFLGIKLINIEDYFNLLLRLCLNFFMCYLIAGRIYSNNIRRSDFTFTYYSLSVLVFLLCYLLANVRLELGFALGLFAIFGIIRYRTSLISIKEMTFLFVIIGVAVFNALANKKVSWVELISANAVIVGIMYAREYLFVSKTLELEMVYDNVQLIHADRRQELYADLGQRLGVEVVDVKVCRIDCVKDAVNVIVYYKERS